MKKVDSQALGMVQKALGLTGAGSSDTDFLDGSVDQVLDVVPVVRRGRTQAGTSGIYYGIIQNSHSGSGALATSVDPYNVGTTPRIEPYPTPMPDSFDVWLLGATVRQTAGAGTISALLSLAMPSAQGWGVDDSGSQVESNIEIPLAFWDAVVTEGLSTFAILNGTRGPWARIGFRVPHRADTSFVWRTTASEAATFDLIVMLGVFPVSLGQDAI